MKETSDTSDIKNNITTVSREKDKFDKTSLHFAKIEMISELKKKIPSKYKPEEAEDSLVYGLCVYFLANHKQIKEAVVYLKPNDENTLMLTEKKKGNSEKLINLYKLSDISFGKNAGNFKTSDIISKIDENVCLTLHLKKNGEYRDLIFKNENDLDLFCFGVLLFLEKTINDAKELNTDLLSLKRIWNNSLVF